MPVETSKKPTETDDFHEQLKTILPRLRVYALSLTLPKTLSTTPS